MKFTVGNREQIISRVNDGKDDFYVFSHVPQQADIELTEFLPNPLVAVCDQRHHLVNEEVVTLEQLKDYPFLRREAGSGTRHAIENFLQEHNSRLNIKMTIESNEAIKHCVMDGLGYSILSRLTLAFGESQGLKVLPVKELPIESNWFLRGKKTNHCPPSPSHFWTMC